MNPIFPQSIGPSRGIVAVRGSRSPAAKASVGRSQVQGCRSAVLAIMAAAPDRMWRAKDLCIELDGEEVNSTLTMVYRALKLLEQDGEVVREWAEQYGRVHSVYRLAQRPAPQPRLRMVCRCCGRSLMLECKDAVLLFAEAVRAHGFVIDDGGRSLHAVCESCEEQAID